MPLAPKKILVLTSTFPDSEDDPCPRFVLDLCLQLNGKDFQVEVLTPQTPNPFAQSSIGGIRVHRFRYALFRSAQKISGRGILPKLRANPLHLALVPPWLTSQAIYYRKLLKQFKPDIILSNWLVPQSLLAAWSTHRTIPIISLSHGTDVRILERLPQFILTHVFKRLDHFVTPSHYLKDRLVHSLGFEAGQITVIAPIVASELLKSLDDKTVERGEVVFLGRADHGKGLAILLEAWKTVRKTFPDAKLKIHGPDLSDVNFERSGIFSRGPYESRHLPDLLKHATMVIVPSVVPEGLGLVSVEAQWLGIPVICSDIGGLGETLVHQKTGILVRPGRPKALAAAIIQLLRSPRDAKIMGTAAKVRAQRLFNPECLSQKWKNLILEQLDSPA